MKTNQTWPFVLLLLSACTANVDIDEGSEEPIAQDAQPINGPDELGEPATMLIRFTYGPTMRGSATLIAPNVVLTNAHASPGGAAGMYVQNSTYTSPNIDAIPVIDKEHHPQYVVSTNYDLGLLRLGCAVTDVTPAQINRTPLETSMKDGDAVKLVGYGPTLSNAGTDWGTKRSLNTTFDNLSTFKFFAPALVNTGDSGGSAYGWPDPVLDDDGGGSQTESAKKAYPQRKLIGVITTKGAGMRRVDKHWQWIDDIVSQWADPNLAPRPSVPAIHESIAPNVCPTMALVGHYSIQNPEPNVVYNWSVIGNASITPNATGTSVLVYTTATTPFTLTVTAEGAGGCTRTFKESYWATEKHCDEL